MVVPVKSVRVSAELPVLAIESMPPVPAVTLEFVRVLLPVIEIEPVVQACLAIPPSLVAEKALIVVPVRVRLQVVDDWKAKAPIVAAVKLANEVEVWIVKAEAVVFCISKAPTPVDVVRAEKVHSVKVRVEAVWVVSEE